VRNGRKREFAEAYAGLGSGWPDPLAQRTFDSAVLDWSAPAREPHRRRLQLVRRLLAIRARDIVPRLAGASGGRARSDRGVITAQWRLADGSQLRLLANLTGEVALTSQGVAQGQSLWGGSPGEELPPWSAHWWLGDA
jgi:hypothetical protein